MNIMEMLNAIVTVVTMIEIGWRIVRRVRRFIAEHGSALDEGDPLDQLRGEYFVPTRLSACSA